MPLGVGYSLAPGTLKALPKGIEVLVSSSMYAPIILFAFVCVASGCKEPDDEL